MGSNGFKGGQGGCCILVSGTSGKGLLGKVGLPLGQELMEMCRRKREEGLDTSQIERFIEEGILASARGQAVYSEVMLRVAYDSLT